MMFTVVEYLNDNIFIKNCIERFVEFYITFKTFLFGKFLHS